MGTVGETVRKVGRAAGAVGAMVRGFLFFFLGVFTGAGSATETKREPQMKRTKTCARAIARARTNRHVSRNDGSTSNPSNLINLQHHSPPNNRQGAIKGKVGFDVTPILIEDERGRNF